MYPVLILSFTKTIPSSHGIGVAGFDCFPKNAAIFRSVLTSSSVSRILAVKSVMEVSVGLSAWASSQSVQQTTDNRQQ